MLNGFAYLGLARAAEALEGVDLDSSARYRIEAESLKKDIRISLKESFAVSPVILLGNGRWIPSVPPWVESRGPVSLHVNDRSWLTHGTVTARDTLVDPKELFGDFILKGMLELFFLKNVAFSQPFYSPHPYAHLKRGEVKELLKEFQQELDGDANKKHSPKVSSWFESVRNLFGDSKPS